MSESTSTDVTEFLGDLNGGVYLEKLGRAFSDVAIGVIQNGKVGKVKLEFDLAQIGNSQQVKVAHKVVFVKPTARGKVSEEDTTETPMYVGRGGKLTVFPEDQHDMFGRQKDA